MRRATSAVAVSVNYTASGGTAAAGQDYTPVSGTLIFPANQNLESFNVPILDNLSNPTAYATVNLTLSQPIGGATLGSIGVAD